VGPTQVTVLDVAMPLTDGLELLQQLRAATGMQEPPAIFLSAGVDRQTVEAAHRLGAAFLAKAFMEEILYAAIEAALANGYQGLQAAVEAVAPIEWSLHGRARDLPEAAYHAAPRYTTAP
jgi:DNA-binding response OmpR family regulator